VNPLLKPVVLITGASSGIGAAFAHIFAQQGHEIVLVARRLAQLDAVADAIAASNRQRPEVLSVDLARSGAGAAIAYELTRRGLEPAIVVNNAGVGLFGSAPQLDLEPQLAMIDLNVRVVTELSLRFVGSMARHRGGLLNVASLAAFFPGPRMAVYFASKAYVLSFTQALHRELAPMGIRVTAFCPGPLRTEFFTHAGIAGDRLPRMFTRSAERAARRAYDGFIQGRAVVVPSAINKIVAAAPRFLPRTTLLSIMAAIGKTIAVSPMEAVSQISNDSDDPPTKPR
jgi:short-subunit dehydrogenase